MGEELKPCPCGKPARYMQCAFGRWSVHCECGFCLEGEYTKERARQLWNTRHESSKPLTVDRLDNLYCKAYQETDSGLPLGPDPLRKLKCHTAGIAAIHSAMPSQDEKDRRIAELTTANKAMREALVDLKSTAQLHKNNVSIPGGKMMEHTKEQIDAVLELAHGTYSMRDELANKYLIVEQQRDKLLAALEQGARDFISDNGTKPKWWTSNIQLIAEIEATK